MLKPLEVLFERYEAQRKQMLQMAAEWNDPQRSYQPRKEAWSLLEELHHLTLTDQEVVRLAASPEMVTQQALEFKKRSHGVPFFVVMLILRCDIRVPVPTERVMPKPGQPLSTLTLQWEQAREQLRRLLETITPENSHLPFAVHPVCGAFTPEQVLKFLLEHGHYHERHMHRLRLASGFPG